METRPIRRKRWRVIGLFAAALVALWAVSLPVISTWGFGRDKIARDLAAATAGNVRFQSFRNVYFPHPGCVAEGVTIQRTGGENPPLVSITRLTIIGSVLGIYRKHVSLMKAEGLQVTPGGVGWPTSANQSKVVIDRLVADDAVLQLRHDGGNQPLRFQVHHFELENIGDGSMPFRVELSNPLPPGEITASGRLGPWKTERREETPISGSYAFRHADLSAIKGIGGLLSSDGKFQGTIRQLHVSGATDTAEFEVVSTGHRFPLKTKFDAEVNATNGDLILQRVEAKLGETGLTAEGSVLPDAQHRRTATLDFVTQDGRIQDILFPFVKGPRSPLNGVTSCRGRVILPAGNEPFLRKVKVNADFGIEDARLTNPMRQQQLNKASEAARGKPDDDTPQNVVSDLKGQVELKDGVARFSKFSFQVPGALASMHGTYNVIDERINLHGIVRLQAKISDTTSGFKGFLLKAISPFIRKDKPQEPLPVAVRGTFEHPQYSVSLTKDNQHRHGM
jgi:hypothetical protein